jgi:serine-threonine kinase receptor-associated protein
MQHTLKKNNNVFCMPSLSLSLSISFSIRVDKLPMLRDGASGDWIGTFQGHKGAVWSCKMDPSGSLAATASGDFSVKVWDAITGKELYTMLHKHIVKTCNFSPSSKYLATGGHEGLLRVYDLTAPKDEPRQVSMSLTPTVVVVVCKVEWQDESTLLVGCGDGTIRVWKVPAAANEPLPAQPVAVMDTKTKKEIRDMETTTTTTSGQSILAVAAGDQVLFYDIAKNYALLKQYKMPVNFHDEGGVSLHPSGSKFIAGGSDLWVRVFDYKSGEMLECLKGHHGPIRCLRYSPDGKTYASGSEDGTIRLWKTDNE